MQCYIWLLFLQRPSHGNEQSLLVECLQARVPSCLFTMRKCGCGIIQRLGSGVRETWLWHGLIVNHIIWYFCFPISSSFKTGTVLNPVEVMWGLSEIMHLNVLPHCQAYKVNQYIIIVSIKLNHAFFSFVKAPQSVDQVFLEFNLFKVSSSGTKRFELWLPLQRQLLSSTPT